VAAEQPLSEAHRRMTERQAPEATGRPQPQPRPAPQQQPLHVQRNIWRWSQITPGWYRVVHHEVAAQRHVEVSSARLGAMSCNTVCNVTRAIGSDDDSRFLGQLDANWTQVAGCVSSIRKTGTCGLSQSPVAPGPALHRGHRPQPPPRRPVVTPDPELPRQCRW